MAGRSSGGAYVLGALVGLVFSAALAAGLSILAPQALGEGDGPETAAAPEATTPDADETASVADAGAGDAETAPASDATSEQPAEETATAEAPASGEAAPETAADEPADGEMTAEVDVASETEPSADAAATEEARPETVATEVADEVAEETDSTATETADAAPASTEATEDETAESETAEPDAAATEMAAAEAETRAAFAPEPAPEPAVAETMETETAEAAPEAAAAESEAAEASTPEATEPETAEAETPAPEPAEQEAAAPEAEATEPEAEPEVAEAPESAEAPEPAAETAPEAEAEAETEVALADVPTTAAPEPFAPAGPPPFEANAIAYDGDRSQPLLAIVVIGDPADAKLMGDLLAAPGPLAVVVPSDAADPAATALEIREAGFEALIGLDAAQAGDAASRAGASDKVIGVALLGDEAGASVSGPVVDMAKARGLAVYDVTGGGAGFRAAKAEGVPAAASGRSIDEIPSSDMVYQQLERAAFDARRTGAFVVTAQAKPSVITGIRRWMNVKANKSVNVAPLSVVIDKIGRQ